MKRPPTAPPWRALAADAAPELRQLQRRLFLKGSLGLGALSLLSGCNVTDADARGSEAIYRDGTLVGRATSGGYGWRVGKSLALAMIQPDHAHIGTELEIAILGTMHRAVIIPDSPFDPDNNALRS